MKYRGRQLSCNLVHIGQHQQQPLRSSKGSGERTRLQRAVDGAGCTAFTLHFDDVRHRTPYISDVLRGPVIGMLAHRRSRSDGINGDHFIGFMGHVCARFVTVQCFMLIDRHAASLMLI